MNATDMNSLNAAIAAALRDIAAILEAGAPPKDVAALVRKLAELVEKPI